MIYAGELMRYPFLSPEWIAAMREIRNDYADYEREVEVDLAANVTITEPPFGDGAAIEGHLDTTGPVIAIEEGHIDAAEFTIEAPYDVAKQLFVDRDPSQLMPALMAGKFKLTGDSSKVLGLAALMAPPAGETTDVGGVDVPVDADVEINVVRELINRIDDITEI